jgi:hypothetical protein
VVTIVSLLIPILVAAVVVWIATAVAWIALPHHKSDFKGFPNEDAVRDAMKPSDIAPGMYDLPHLASRDEMQDPEVKKKFEEGPAGFFTIVPRGVPAMGKPMVISFIFNIVVSVCVAYVAGRTIPAGASFLSVFRITATVGWLAYSAAVVPESVWFGRPWKYTGKLILDGLAYGLLTGCIFGWFWPS